MLEIKTKVKVETGYTPDTLPLGLLTGTQPILFKGLVKDWPIVKAANQSFDHFANYLLQFYKNTTVNLNIGSPDLDGRFFYNDDMTGVNVDITRAPFSDAINTLSDAQTASNPPLVYVASTTVDTCLPGFRVENDIKVPHDNPLVSLWMGNQSRIAAHYDLPDNLACVAAGKRRFTLFPPDQLENLYVGPIDFTPAGQAVSMVDFHNVDHDQYPKFEDALEMAQVADMDAGDALFLPSMWWHHVEGQSSYNLLVNYWWRTVPAFMGPPATALEHAILSIRDLPDEQKQIWKDIFNHYVFSSDNGNFDHIPQDKRGMLNPLDDNSARRIRSILLQKLNR